MPIKTVSEQNLTWVNIEGVDDDSVKFLKDNYKFHPLDLEDVRTEVQTPKLDVYKNYLFLVLHFPEWSHEDKRVTSQQIDFFIMDNALITVQHNKNKDLQALFYRCVKNKKNRAEWMSNNSGFLLYYILDALFGEARPILNNIGKHLALVETEVFSGEQNAGLIRQLSSHRRNILAFGRIVEPQRYLMSNLAHTRRPFLDENTSVYFDDIRDYLDKLWSIVDNYKESVHGLYITVESLINQRTNRVLTMLTIVSVALLPHTLFFNMYGMNLSVLPGANHPTAAWWALGILTVIVVGGLMVAIRRMKKNGWF